ncbi:hypothetical protein M422DRAFT_273637 [Sphaerobolus stellatus SS14]|uniref:Unplaced genomic scaffold SPHSTscaffold_341, whole genome shotgun sequence n=1 Tax=Sphaerobolus stellatus (strain SS14) TaxID=990650 RepID=A0A0C9TUD6_SPHS4|nr:hypothetical protein M422DRAFT_273637 [Sphaerobolus stellatus SS14]
MRFKHVASFIDSSSFLLPRRVDDDQNAPSSRNNPPICTSVLDEDERDKGVDVPIIGVTEANMVSARERDMARKLFSCLQLPRHASYAAPAMGNATRQVHAVFGPVQGGINDVKNGSSSFERTMSLQHRETLRCPMSNRTRQTQGQ